MQERQERAGSRRGLEDAFYGSSAERVEPESSGELVDLLLELEGARRLIVPAGGGSHAYLGNLPERDPVIVSSCRIAEVIAYEPEDYTIAVSAGLSLSALREILSANGQEIATDFAASTPGTVGGLVAAAVPGPRRASTGPLRSQIIGIHALRSGGRRYKAGGMVVKNVAGYEVGKFLCGSLGTAGFIERVNLKLRALPELRRGGRASFGRAEDAWAFADVLRDERLEPALLTVLDTRTADRCEGIVPESARSAAAAHVLWMFEGNSSLVESLDARVMALLGGKGRVAAGTVDVEISPFEGGRRESASSGSSAERVLDRLSEIREPLEHALETELIVRVSVLSSRMRALCDSVRQDLSARGVERVDLVADTLSGQAFFATRPRKTELESIVEVFTRRVRDVEGVAWLHSAPPSLRRRVPYLLLEDRNRVTAAKILRVFDPEGLYCPGRVLGDMS